MADVPLGRSRPLVTPIHPSAVYVLPDLDTLDRIYGGTEPGYIYARDGHPNADSLAAEVARLEAAESAVVCGSGMSAIAAVVLAHVRPGDSILASNQLYGRTVTLLGQEFRRLGISTAFVDVFDPAQVRDGLQATKAKLLLVETLSNPLLRLPDIASLAAMCRKHGCLFVVDNTFATPAVFRPLESGAAIVVESLTKLMTGHSDVTLGAVCGGEEMAKAVSTVASIWGFMAHPFECWLAQRGLETLHVRVGASNANASAIADWLAEQPNVTRVIYPGRSDHPDHEVARRLLGDRFGNMVTFELAGGRDAVNRFFRKATGIPFSPSLGHTGTTCSHPATTSHRFESPDVRQRLGITDGLIRLSVGIEPLEEIEEELRQGLAAARQEGAC